MKSFCFLTSKCRFICVGRIQEIEDYPQVKISTAFTNKLLSSDRAKGKKKGLSPKPTCKVCGLTFAT